jgi:hypothetical protein
VEGKVEIFTQLKIEPKLINSHQFLLTRENPIPFYISLGFKDRLNKFATCLKNILKVSSLMPRSMALFF